MEGNQWYVDGLECPAVTCNPIKKAVCVRSCYGQHHQAGAGCKGNCNTGKE
jgi:hypothetical protein